MVTLAPSAAAASIVQDFTACAVDMHDAGAALRRVAADMRAGQAEILAQELDEQRAGLDLPRRRPCRSPSSTRSTCRSSQFLRRACARSIRLVRRSSEARRMRRSAQTIGPPRKPMAALVSTSSSISCTAASTPCSSPSRSHLRTGGDCCRRHGLAAGLGGEAGEELVGELLGGGIDQPRAELRQLAADLRVRDIGEERAVAVLGERARRPPPLAKPATPPLPSPQIV